LDGTIVKAQFLSAGSK